MNKLLLVVVVILVLVGGGYYFMSQQSQAPAEDVFVEEETVVEESGNAMVGGTAVEIQNFAFSPATLTVKVGDTVTWVNQDSVGHSATADDGSFDTGVLSQGESNTVTFTEAGTFGYHCTPHPNITGTVIVEP